MIPRLKSSRLVDTAHSQSGSRAMGALKATPSTKATVRFPVKKEATIPMESMANPTNQ